MLVRGGEGLAKPSTLNHKLSLQYTSMLVRGVEGLANNPATSYEEMAGVIFEFIVINVMSKVIEFAFFVLFCTHQK